MDVPRNPGGFPTAHACPIGGEPELMEAPEEAETDYVWFRCALGCGRETDSFDYIDDAASQWNAKHCRHRDATERRP